jgi:hypothetical protein
MSDRYKKCLPVVLSRSLKDETMFDPWTKVYLLLSTKDESIKFRAKKQRSDWKSWGLGLFSSVLPPQGLFEPIYAVLHAAGTFANLTQELVTVPMAKGADNQPCLVQIATTDKK